MKGENRVKERTRVSYLDTVYNSVCGCRHIHININSFVSTPLNITKIAVMKCIIWQKAMVTPAFYIRSISVEKNKIFARSGATCSMDIMLSKNPSEAAYFASNLIRDTAKKTKFQKSEITMEVGGLVQVSLGTFFVGKSSQNSPKPVVIFWSSIPCVFCLHMHCYKLLVIMI